MMLNLFRNRRGVALMMVLAAVAVLTSMGVEFAYNTGIYYDLAQNEASRLRAYYLAKSAYNFMQLELKFDKMFQKIVKSQNLGQYLGGNAQLPLCQQFPLSTGLIRAVFVSGQLPGMGGAGGGEEGKGEQPTAGADEKGKGAEKIEEEHKEISISQEQGAKEFLEFEGDFDGECIDEGTKINLNGFYGLSTTPAQEGVPSAYDQYQQLLFRFMSQPKYKPLFDAADLRVTDVVTNIGDWVDANAEVNGFGGRGGGAESAIYQQQGLTYPVRSGKLLTLLETYLIAGVTDEWFEPMIDSFTVYGDATINVCQASKEVVESLIRRYVDATPDLPPLRLEDPEEMGRLTQAISDACASGQQGDQLKQAIAQGLSQAIGIISGATPAPVVPTPPPGTPGAPPTPPVTGTATGPGAAFVAYLRTDARFYQLKLAGQVGDVTVRIKVVLDVQDNDPKKWKLLYWKVY